MKFLPIFIFGALSAVRLYALESSEITAVAKQFNNPNPNEQFLARMELNRLVAQATLPGKGDPAAVTKVLVAALQSPDTSEEAAKYILRSLARVGTVDAIEPLAKILAGENMMLSEEAREALSWIHDPKAATLLESALTKNSKKREKRALIDALANLKYTTSIPAIAPYVIDPDPDLARAAIDALASIGGPTAVDTLTAALVNEKLAPPLKPEVENALLVASSGDLKIANQIYQSTKSSPLKVAAFLVLLEKSPVSAKTPLIEAAMKSSDSSLRHTALARGIQANLPSLQSSLTQSIGQMSAEDRRIVLANIHHLKPAEVAEKIALSCIASTDEDERISAITALGEIGTTGAFVADLQAIGAREPRVSQAAANALATMAYPAAPNKLTALLKGTSSSEKILAIKAMNSVQVPDAGVLLIEILKGPDPLAAKEAMKTLYFIASMEDLRLLTADATAATDVELRKDLISISSRIATRLNTAEAGDLVKDLK